MGAPQEPDCSVPVGFLSSTPTHPDLGYRRPHSLPAAVAAADAARAREVLECRRGEARRRAFTMAEVDPAEHLEARARVARDRRRADAAAAAFARARARRRRFLTAEGEPAPRVEDLRKAHEARKRQIVSSEVPRFRDAAPVAVAARARGEPEPEPEPAVILEKKAATHSRVALAARAPNFIKFAVSFSVRSVECS